jgi:hypothetical protein
MSLYRQPMYQQQMQRAQAKASMRGNRPKTEALQSRLAEMDLARKLAFESLGLQKKRSDLSHAGRSENLKQSKKALKKRREQLPWELGIGSGTALLSALEGKRRAGLVKANTKKQDDRFNEIMEAYKDKTRPMSPYAGQFSGYGL